MFASTIKGILNEITHSGIVSKICFSSRTREFKEVSVKVPWGQVSGKWWEPYDTRPVLTLHGWQDNCGSFDRLIPLLNSDVGFLTLDFPGHGYSSWLPQATFYNYYYFFLTIRSVMNHFKWPKVSLMGHSMGGVTSYIFSMIYNKEVDFLICLDGAKPMVPVDKGKRLASILTKYFKYVQHASDTSKSPAYSWDEIVAKVCQPNNKSILPEYAKHIIERSIAPSKFHEGKFYFTRDPRLKVTDFTMFCQDELTSLAQEMKSPIFIAKAKEGSYYEVKENFYEVLDVLKRTSIDCDFNYVNGTHHMHLNNPEDVSNLIRSFIRRNNIEDRSVGGLTEDVIVNERNLIS